MPHWTDEQIDWYAEKFGDDPTNEWLVDAARLEGHEAVLDIGCGTGSALRHAAAAGHSGRLVGVDPFARMIQHAERQRGSATIEFVVAPAENLPFENDTFDATLAINSVHHWNDIDAGLAEMARVLTSGGIFTYGGEIFGTDMLPEGQDYSDRLETLGFSVEPRLDLKGCGAFAARAVKVGRDV